MKLSQICIDRPVLATVLSLILVLIGLLGYSHLNMRHLPYVFRPVIYVSADYSGASAKLVESSVTDPLEKSLAMIPNVDFMHSESKEGKSQINIHFKAITESTFTVALSQVQRAVSEVSSLLPENVRPTVNTAGMDGNFIMAVGFTDSHMSQMALSNFVENNINKEVEHVKGVGYIWPWAYDLALRIEVNPQKLASYGLSLSGLLKTLDGSNTPFAVGSVVNKDQIIPINASVPMGRIRAFENLVIQNKAGRLLRLKDIATIKMAAKDVGGAIGRMDGKPATGMAIISGQDANPITVGAAVRHKLQAIRATLPPGMHMTIIFDATTLLKASVHEVFKTVLEAIILVCLVILIFLGRWRAALIPIVTIPVCLLSSFSIVYALGFTINILTLLAMVLAVGMVVDDAIVVLENTHRHVEAGMSGLAASRKSVGEISFAVIGMTICLLAVYFPTVFMMGQTAIYFREFAFTLAASILISGFVALTLTPMMCGRLLHRGKLNRYESRLDHIFTGAKNWYQSHLTKVLRHPWRVIMLLVVVVGCGFWLLSDIHSGLMPPALSPFARLYITGPKTMNADALYHKAKPLIQRIDSLPTVSHVFAWVSGNNGADVIGFVRLKNQLANHNRRIEGAVQDVTNMVKATPGLSGGGYPDDMNAHNHGQQGGLKFLLVMGGQSYLKMVSEAKIYAKTLRDTGLFSTVNNSLKLGGVNYELKINRALAANLNVPLTTIQTALHTYFGGKQLESYYRVGNQRFPIIVSLPQKDLKDFSILKHIYVSASQDVGSGADTQKQLLPLSRFVTAHQILSLPTREHFDQQRDGSMYVNLKPGVSLGQAVKTIESVAQAVLPPGSLVHFTGSARQMIQNNHGMSLIFILGLVFIFLVLAALFESFIDPLIILLTVPACIVGALLILWLTGSTLNTYTGVGLVTLIGLVSKHGILITQFANQKRREGKKIFDAVVEAAAIRLRPILMTTLTMILGAVPLVLATGPGYLGRMQIGLVIVAGLIVGTLFSLFVVPVAYCLLARLKK